MSQLSSHGCREVALTQEQKYKLEVASVAFMQECPFYAHLSYSIAKYVFTRDVPTAATDGRHIIINPDYFCGLKTGEQIFVLAHEMSHMVCHHPQRLKHYHGMGEVKGLPFDARAANIAMDFVINADIIATVPKASCNPDWLFDPNMSAKGEEAWEDIYHKLFNQQKQPKGGGGRRRDAPGALKGQQGDKAADSNGGMFDEVRAPAIDPGTQTEDLPDENEFQEAVSRAFGAAKAMGKMPGNLERRIREILDPQVDWRDHIRMLITSKIGTDRTTWSKANRRRLVFDPIVIMPGKTGFGADTVVVGIDTSGSIGERELDAFLSEVKGVMADCRPKRVVVIGCDAKVTQVDELATMDEFEGLVAKGVKGGGGTRFTPVFEHCVEHDITPDTMIYLTDMYGSFPTSAPGYPVIWAATSDMPAPFGEVVRIRL